MSISPRICRAVAGALLAAFASAVSHAQSSYVLTTLKPPTSGKLAATNGFLGHTFGIDASDQVVGRAAYYAGYYFDTNAPYFRTRYDPYVVRWPASTAASVLPTKVIKAPEWTYLDLSVSQDAKKVLMTSSGDSVVDVATMKAGLTIPATLDALAVNSAGTVVWNSRDGSLTTFGTWNATSGTTTFPAIQGGWAHLKSLNSKGVAVGWAQASTDPLKRAAMWVGGQLSVLDQRPGVGSEAVLINDAGTVVAQSLQPYCHGSFYCDHYPGPQGILANGVFTPIAGPDGPIDNQVAAQAMNNQGVVVGYLNPLDQDPAGRRGFIWRNNTLTDVTELLRSKGVALPVGAVITDVLAINDKGSMVAAMKAGNVTSLVRLSAKP